MRIGLIGLALLVGCSSTGPSDGLPSGAYVVSATVNGAAIQYAFTVVSATDDLVTFDWTAGDVRGTFPIRAEATWNGDGYRVQFLGNAQGANRWMRFTATTCEGANFSGTTTGPITTVPWVGCAIGRP